MVCGLLTTYAGLVVAGGTAQYVTPAAADSAGAQGRNYVMIHNPDLTTDLWYDFDTPAVAAQPSIRLPAGATHFFDQFVPAGRISVLSGTISKPFVVKVSQ